MYVTVNAAKLRWMNAFLKNLSVNLESYHMNSGGASVLIAALFAWEPEIWNQTIPYLR